MITGLPSPSSAGQDRKGSKRMRRAHLSIWAIIGGMLALGALALFLDNLQDTDLADPTKGLTTDFKSSDIAETTLIRFADQARERGIDFSHGSGKRTRMLPEDNAGGLAWGDIDGDGDWDLYIVNFPTVTGDVEANANRLYRNDDGQFTDITNEAGVSDPDGFGMGASFADYDGDGDQDLYVSNYGPNRLFRNSGSGVFEEVAHQAGVNDSLWGTGVTWGDYDRDGHLDFYVCNYVNFDAEGFEPGYVSSFGAYMVPFTLNPNSFDPQPNRLYRNHGDGTFEEVAEKAGVSNFQGRSFSAVFCDLDGDGWLDLYVNNDVSTNKLYRNMGGEFQDEEPIFFSDFSTLSGTADPRGSMGLSVGEIGFMTGKPDGLPDLFITHWVAQENAFYQSLVIPGHGVEYRDKTRRFRLGELSLDMVGWGCALADFDLDGRPDIAVANGSTLEEKNDPTQLRAESVFIFWNDGKIFHNVAPYTGDPLAERYWARGLATADFDSDGDVDIAIAINQGQPLLLQNQTITQNHSLVLKLKGPDAARFGAKVELELGTTTQTQWWGADVTYLGMHAPDLIFGLGQNQSAHQIRIHWADGKTTIRDNVQAGTATIHHPATSTPMP